MVFSLSIFHRGLDKRAMKTNETNDSQFEILKTGTTVSDSPSWLNSLVSQIRELRDDGKNPRPQLEMTSQRELNSLEKIVETPSPVLSIFADLRDAVNDVICPRKIDTTVQLVEVEEICSKPKPGVPNLISVG